MPKQNYIIFSTGRKDKNPFWMTVIDGLPYYRSNGVLSHTPNVWYPFICIAGKHTHYFDALPDYYDRAKMQGFIRRWGPQVLIKHEDDYFIRAKHKRDVILGGSHIVLKDVRIGTKKSFIISARLKSSFPLSILQEAGLTAEEVALTDVPIEFEDKPVFISKDFDKVNEWLIEQGAVLAAALLRNEKVQEFKEVVEVRYNQEPNKLTEAEVQAAWLDSQAYDESLTGRIWSFFQSTNVDLAKKHYLTMLESTDEIKYVLATRYVKEYPNTVFAIQLQKFLVEKETPMASIKSLTAALKPLTG